MWIIGDALIMSISGVHIRSYRMMHMANPEGKVC